MKAILPIKVEHRPGMAAMLGIEAEQLRGAELRGNDAAKKDLTNKDNEGSMRVEPGIDGDASICGTHRAETLFIKPGDAAKRY